MERDITTHDQMLWVHKPVKEFDYQVGFVPCSQKEFDKYVDSDIAQDPAHGAHHLKALEAGSEAQYQTKVMTKKKRTTKKKVAAKSDESDSEG